MVYQFETGSLICSLCIRIKLHTCAPPWGSNDIIYAHEDKSCFHVDASALIAGCMLIFFVLCLVTVAFVLQIAVIVVYTEGSTMLSYIYIWETICGLSNLDADAILLMVMWQYNCIVNGAEALLLFRDFIRYLSTGKKSSRLARALVKWEAFSKRLIEKEHDKFWLEKAIINTRTWWDDPLRHRRHLNAFSKEETEQEEQESNEQESDEQEWESSYYDWCF